MVPGLCLHACWFTRGLMVGWRAFSQFPRALWQRAVDYALPPRCPSCGVIVGGDDQFCLACWAALDFIGPSWCDRCQLPLGDGTLAGDWCASCLAEEPPFDQVCAAVHYSKVSAGVVLKLKYGRRIGMARLIANQLQRHLPPGEGESWLIIPVPLHPLRLWERGFNQSLLIAQHLAKGTAHKIEPELLRRVKRTRPLKGLSPKQRDREVRSVFRLADGRKPDIKGRNVILVDDVFTSGATARACARQLKRAGAVEVRIFCWARVVPGRDALDLAYDASDMNDVNAR